MAELFLAKDTRSNRMVVLKRILPHLAEKEEFVRMFLDEARIAALLRHPNIVELIELGRRDSSTFIAMEWVEGIDLRRVLYKERERSGVVPPGVAAWIVARLCEGLGHAHERTDADGVPLGIVHRDISPQNVMITYRGEVKLVDFGIAKATAWMDRSKPGVIKGKFLYLAPEQLMQEKADARVDLFASGTLLYELTTGKSPFYRETSEEVILAVRAEDPEAPVTVRPGFPVMLSRIILKCLMKDRAKRYQSADELRVALEDFMRMDAPTTRGDVVRYVASLFGNEEERTSLFIPPNARGPDDEASGERVPTAPPVPTPPPPPVPPRKRPERDPEPTAPMETSGRVEVGPDTTAPLTPALHPGDSRPTPPVVVTRDYESTANLDEVAREFARALEATKPPPLPKRPPSAPPVPTTTAAPSRPKPSMRRLAAVKRPADPDDFVSTVELENAEAEISRTYRDAEVKGRRVLLGIVLASAVLLSFILTLTLWPAPAPGPVSVEAPVQPLPTPAHRVRVVLRAPRGTAITIDGAPLPGTSFEQEPGPVTIEWKCRKKRRLISQKRTFEVADVESVTVDLTCP